MERSIFLLNIEIFLLNKSKINLIKIILDLKKIIIDSRIDLIDIFRTVRRGIIETILVFGILGISVIAKNISARLLFNINIIYLLIFLRYVIFSIY
jgi:hypothetical protein